MATVIETPTEASAYTFAEKIHFEDSNAGEYYNVLLRGLTHKLNNQLAVIQGFSSLIMMDEGLEASTKENLDHMREAATSASGLSERILASGGCVRMHCQSINLSDFIPMIESNLREPFVARDIPFQLNLAGQVPNVTIDSGRFKEILLELLMNAADAVEASKSGGEVALDILPPGEIPESRPGCIDIFVRNTGSTIPADKLQKIFEPFYSTKESSHYGIGLTNAGVLASQMDMTVGVKSQDDTTTFWVSAPAC